MMNWLPASNAQTDDQFGMQPVSAAGGSVKVKNEIAVEYRIVARGR